MATVLECMNALGLAHSPLVLTIIGKHIKNQFSYSLLTKKPQTENGEIIFVNDYKEDVTGWIKEEIILFSQRKFTKDIAKASDRYIRNLLEDTGYETVYKGWGFPIIIKRKYDRPGR